MARSIEEQQPRPARGYIPPQDDRERFLMRHIEDLARTAMARGIPRYSAFLSDREQALAKAALSTHFYGGAEANVAVALANWGEDAAFVSKVPAHAIGQAAVNSLRNTAKA